MENELNKVLKLSKCNIDIVCKIGSCLKANKCKKDNLITRFDNPIFMGAIMLLTCVVSDLFFSAPIFGAIIGFAVGAFLNYFIKIIQLDKNSNSIDENQSEEIYCRVLDLENNLNKICDILNEINDKPSELETEYFSILDWFRRLYDINEYNSENIKEELVKLLNFNGYQFVEYSVEKAHMFTQSSLPGISVCQTTKHALQNTRTGECIIKGHVIVP